MFGPAVARSHRSEVMTPPPSPPPPWLESLPSVRPYTCPPIPGRGLYTRKARRLLANEGPRPELARYLHKFFGNQIVLDSLPSLRQRRLWLPRLKSKANEAHAKEPSGLSESFLQRNGLHVQGHSARGTAGTSS